MTDELDLDALEKLEKAATAGPWEVWQTSINGVKYPGKWVERSHDEQICISGSGGARSWTQRVIDRQDHDDNDANAELIAALRNAAPALIAAANERDGLLSSWAECRSLLSNARALLDKAEAALDEYAAFDGSGKLTLGEQVYVVTRSRAVLVEIRKAKEPKTS